MNYQAFYPTSIHLSTILAIPLAVLALFSVVFALLIFRQARQMTQVLPTPLSPTVTISVVAYLIFTCVTLGLIILSFWS
jgi:hypothetical protein